MIDKHLKRRIQAQVRHSASKMSRKQKWQLEQWIQRGVVNVSRRVEEYSSMLLVTVDRTRED